MSCLGFLKERKMIELLSRLYSAFIAGMIRSPNTGRIIPSVKGAVQSTYTTYKRPVSSNCIPFRVDRNLPHGVDFQMIWGFTLEHTPISYTQQPETSTSQTASRPNTISYVSISTLPISISYIGLLNSPNAASYIEILGSPNAVSYIGISPVQGHFSIITVVTLVLLGAVQEDLTSFSSDPEEDSSDGLEQSSDESESTSSDPRKPGVIYARVSTNKQAEDGRSLEAQTDDLHEIAERNDIDLICDPIKDEGETGTDFDRDGIKQVFQLASTGKISYLLVDDISRIGRNAPQTLHYVYLLRSKCDVVIITHSGELNVRRVQDLLEMTMKALISHMSTLGRARSALRSRVRGFTEDRNWRSGFPHGVPLGYTETDDGWIQPDMDEAEVIQRMFDQFLETESYTATAETLNNEFEGTLEDPLSYGQVKNYLQKPVYIGRPTVHAELNDTGAGQEQSEHVVEDPMLSLVDREAFDRVARTIDEISTKNAREDDTLDLEKAIDEFGLFPVENSSPIVNLACESCGGVLRKNGQRDLSGEINCHNYQCVECGKQRKFPTQSEFSELVKNN